MSMHCHVVQDLFSLYQDDILSDETRAEVDAHLAECDSCRAFYEDMRALYRRPSDRVAKAKSYQPDVDLDFANVAKKLRRAKRRNWMLGGAVVALLLAAGVTITNQLDRRMGN